MVFGIRDPGWATAGSVTFTEADIRCVDCPTADSSVSAFGATYLRGQIASGRLTSAKVRAWLAVWPSGAWGMDECLFFFLSFPRQTLLESQLPVR